MNAGRTVADLTVTVVMPAFNEADGIGGFLEEVSEELNDRVGKLGIVVVDDCSTDETAAVVGAVAQESRTHVTYQCNTENQGHGPTALAAYRAGLESGSDIVVHVDGDGQFEVEDIMKAISIIASGADAVVGVRTGRTDPWFRQVISRALRSYLRLISGVKASDPNCPLRAYRSDVLRDLLDFVPANSMVPSIYLTILDHRKVGTLVDLPVRSIPRRGVGSVGTTWGRQRRQILPSRRLVKFVLRAARESAFTIPRLGARSTGRSG